MQETIKVVQNSWILLVVCAATAFIRAYVLEDHSASSVAQCLVSHAINHGVPKTIWCDRAKQYIKFGAQSGATDEEDIIDLVPGARMFCQDKQIKLIVNSSSYSPDSNSALAECAVKIFKPPLYLTLKRSLVSALTLHRLVGVTYP